MEICRLIEEEYKLTSAKLLSIWNCEKKFTSKYPKVIGGNQSNFCTGFKSYIYTVKLSTYQMKVEDNLGLEKT